jgi:hypothetical protein
MIVPSLITERLKKAKELRIARDNIAGIAKNSD